MPTRQQSRRYLTGLIGNGIGASRSPALHEGEADAQGIRLVYSLFDLASEGENEESLQAMLDAAKRMRFAGLNVTHPYKQRVIPLLDELSEEARRIGAVNTIAFHDGIAKGYNTDSAGFAESLRHGLSDGPIERVVQLGAGGAGAATANALLEHGTGTLYLHDVRRERVEALSARLASAFGEGRVELVDDPSSAIRMADGLVNATPIGMDAYPGSPVALDLLRPSMWVADVIYFPLETALLRHARAIGCRTLNGSRMVVFQDGYVGLAPVPRRRLNVGIVLGPSWRERLARRSKWSIETASSGGLFSRPGGGFTPDASNARRSSVAQSPDRRRPSTLGALRRCADSRSCRRIARGRHERTERDGTVTIYHRARQRQGTDCADRVRRRRGRQVRRQGHRTG